MASKLVVLGNITAISLTLLAFLQIIPWSLIGLMILATLILPMLFSGRSNRNIRATPPPKQNPSRPEPIRVETIPSQKSSLVRPAVKPELGGPLTENSVIISKGDYEKYEVDLKEGNVLVVENADFKEVTATVNNRIA